MRFDQVFWPASTNWPSVVTLITTFIALGALGVAYQQFVTNRRQFRLALFEKRMAVYDAVTKFQSVVLARSNADLNHFYEYYKDSKDHRFLFGKDVADHIDETIEKGATVWGMRQNDPIENPAALTELLLWFSEQQKQTPRRFLKYMDFRKP